jgi:hypothetical protein
VNMTLSVIDPTLGKFDWLKVNVPQGRYRLDFYVLTKVLSSNLFNVTNGVDTSCLVVPSQSSILPSSTSSVIHAPTPTPSPSPSTSSMTYSSAALPTPVMGGLSLSVHKGVIAGGVIGGVVLLALIATLALCVFRRRKTRAHCTTPACSGPRTKGQPSKRLHNPSDSTGTILPFGGGDREKSPQLSEEDFESEKSAAACEDARTNLTPVAPTRTYSKSSTSSRRPVSMTVKPSFESHETIQSRRPPHRSLDSSAVPPNKSFIPPSPSSPSHPRYPPDRTRRASRKPVPVYDPSEFPTSEPDGIPLVGRSETSLGGGTRIHYLIPDAPLQQRN